MSGGHHSVYGFFNFFRAALLGTGILEIYNHPIFKTSECSYASVGSYSYISDNNQVQDVRILCKQIYIGLSRLFHFHPGLLVPNSYSIPDQSTISVELLQPGHGFSGMAICLMFRIRIMFIQQEEIILVTLTATSDSGCADTWSNNLQINYQPEAAFIETNTQFGQSVQFTDVIQLQEPDPELCAWDLETGTQMQVPSPQHTYPNVVANYNVQLIITLSEWVALIHWLRMSGSTLCPQELVSKIVANACQNNAIAVPGSIKCFWRYFV